MSAVGGRLAWSASAVAVALVVAACASLGAQTRPQPVAGKADVIIKDMAAPEPVIVKVGQTIGVTWPGGPAVWQVDFPPDEVVLLTPLAKLSNPGAAGWVWRATKAAEIEIIFTARIPCPNPPCGDENPRRYAIAIRIQK